MRQIFAIALMAMVVMSKRDKSEKKERKNKRNKDEIESDDDEIVPLIDESLEFAKYQAKFNKFYSNVEDYTKANDCWRKSRAKVRNLNKINKGKGVSFDDNWTSDLDDDEFKSILGLDTSDLVPAE